MGSRWASALIISAGVVGFAGAAFAGTGSIDCTTLRWDGDGSYAEINGERVAVEGSRTVQLGKTYSIEWFGPLTNGDGEKTDEIGPWSTAPTVLTAPETCASSISVAAPTTAAAVPTTAPVPPTQVVTSTTVITGIPPVATTAPTALDLTTASQRLPETGQNSDLLQIVGGLVLAAGAALWFVGRRPRPAR